MLSISSNGAIASGLARVVEAEGEALPSSQEVAANPGGESVRVSQENRRRSSHRAQELAVAVRLERSRVFVTHLVRRDLTLCALQVRIQV